MFLIFYFCKTITGFVLYSLSISSKSSMDLCFSIFFLICVSHFLLPQNLWICVSHFLFPQNHQWICVAELSDPAIYVLPAALYRICVVQFFYFLKIISGFVLPSRTCCSRQSIAFHVKSFTVPFLTFFLIILFLYISRLDKEYV